MVELPTTWNSRIADAPNAAPVRREIVALRDAASARMGAGVRA